MQRRQNSGFTLIEMMITVAVIGILASIAVPSYHNAIERSRVSTAGSDLVTMATVLENAFQRRLSYPEGETESTGQTMTLITGWSPTDREHFEYTATVTDNTYTLTASRKGKGLSCKLTLDEKGNRTIAGDCGGASSW